MEVAMNAAAFPGKPAARAWLISGTSSGLGRTIAGADGALPDPAVSHPVLGV